MKKIILYVVIAGIVLVGGFFVLNSYIYDQKQGDQKIALSPQEATYIINGQVIELTNGVSEIEAAPGSASKIITRYFGNEVQYDFDGDSRLDTAFLLTQETGGSGIFYYVAAALNKESGYVGSQGLLLGDRIAPQTTEMGKGKIVIVNYADRKPGEDFSVSPSVGKSIWLLLDPETMQFGEVAQNFEGEADPSRMSLSMKTWTWINALYNDGRTVTPKKSGAFTITFSEGGKFSATTDCNRISGTYSANKNQLSFGQMATTKMYCEGSEEGDFAKLLTDTQSYQFTAKGELILDLKFDSGSVTFR